MVYFARKYRYQRQWFVFQDINLLFYSIQFWLSTLKYFLTSLLCVFVFVTNRTFISRFTICSCWTKLTTSDCAKRYRMSLSSFSWDLILMVDLTFACIHNSFPHFPRWVYINGRVPKGIFWFFLNFYTSWRNLVNM